MSKYDIVVYGATGFTGQMAAEYLAKKIHEGDPTGPKSASQIALAGRSRKKLEELSNKIATRFGNAAGKLYFDVIEADSSDAKSIDEMVRQTKVVLAAAGPFVKYGGVVVGACAKHGVHYCDITGETYWNRKMIDKHHQEAINSGAVIVSFCGMDSIPFDIGTVYLVDYVKKNFADAGLGEVQTIVRVENGALSGGTFQTAMAMRDHATKEELADPYLLNPRGDKFAPRTPPRPQDMNRWLPWKEPERGWVAPFVMAMINTKVVRRSWRLFENSPLDYGPKFAYKYEGHDLGGLFVAALLSIGLLIFDVLTNFTFVRKFLQKYGPQSGDGPSPKARETVRTWIRITGRVDVPKFRKTAYVDVKGGDLGYTETAQMVAESALVLAQGTDLRVKGGVVTPAFAFGPEFAERLTKTTGVKFSVGTLN
eukprot:TRINITY_DN1032_c0_g1_i1.p2 TRINITY_DN1032_c0_g1~~TRINITY_DN1032_c0_g1_i1.p2  ORF type:complete len:424 (-),score=112.91 TRINITY_DN1032_c0_g1_i1:2680-3951(-)